MQKNLAPKMALKQTTDDESTAELVTHPAGTFCNRTPRLHSHLPPHSRRRGLGGIVINTPNPKKGKTQMQTPNKIEWAKLLSEAVNEPGKISDAYRRFHGYSLGNRLWALAQCSLRGIAPGPIASFKHWKELGRQVKKGEKGDLPLHARYCQTQRQG